MEVAPGMVIQIHPNLRWGGCFAMVVKAESWGVVADIPIPELYGHAHAPVRLGPTEFEVVGPARWVWSDDPSEVP